MKAVRPVKADRYCKGGLLAAVGGMAAAIASAARVRFCDRSFRARQP
jgi:hypothetical protein